MALRGLRCWPVASAGAGWTWLVLLACCLIGHRLKQAKQEENLWWGMCGGRENECLLRRLWTARGKKEGLVLHKSKEEEHARSVILDVASVVRPRSGQLTTAAMGQAACATPKKAPGPAKKTHEQARNSFVGALPCVFAAKGCGCGALRWQDPAFFAFCSNACLPWVLNHHSYALPPLHLYFSLPPFAMMGPAPRGNEHEAQLPSVQL